MDAKQNFFDLHIQFFEIFKFQDPKSIHLDVVFDIGGKKLYGNKSRLSAVSPTFESMFSERWTSKDGEPIKINNYSFDDFKEFLTFIYSGACSLSDENIFSMIDMAEYYGIHVLKNVCDHFLSKMTITMENVLSILETSNKYSLVEVKDSLQLFIATNFNSIVKDERFLNTRKETVGELIKCVHNAIKPEELFQAVYEWVEHQVKQKAESHGLNLNEAIKVEMTPFLPHFEFKKMNVTFLVDYVVKRGFLFSYDELSDILMQNMSADVKVKVTISTGNSISGYLPRDSDAVNIIKSLKNVKPAYLNAKMIYWNTKCKLPSTPSQIKKRDGVEWYLIFFDDGDIGVQHRSEIDETDYLIAEMTAEFPEFVFTENSIVEIE